MCCWRAHARARGTERSGGDGDTRVHTAARAALRFACSRRGPPTELLESPALAASSSRAAGPTIGRVDLNVAPDLIYAAGVGLDGRVRGPDEAGVPSSLLEIAAGTGAVVQVRGCVALVFRYHLDPHDRARAAGDRPAAAWRDVAETFAPRLCDLLVD